MAVERKKFLWNTSHTKKVKLKEIREYNVVHDEDLQTHSVVVYGFFGGAVKVLECKSARECEEFIDTMTEDEKQESRCEDVLQVA